MLKKVTVQDLFMAYGTGALAGTIASILIVLWLSTGESSANALLAPGILGVTAGLIGALLSPVMGEPFAAASVNRHATALTGSLLAGTVTAMIMFVVGPLFMPMAQPFTFAFLGFIAAVPGAFASWKVCEVRASRAETK